MLSFTMDSAALHVIRFDAHDVRRLQFKLSIQFLVPEAHYV